MSKQLADRHAAAAALMGDDASPPIPAVMFKALLGLTVASVGVGAVVGVTVSVGIGFIVCACVFGVAELLTLGCSIVNQNACTKLAVERITRATTLEIMQALSSERFTGHARELAYEVLERRDEDSLGFGTAHATHA